MSAASRHPLETADCFRHGEFDARLFRCPMCAAEREDADGSYYIAERRAALADLDREALIEMLVETWHPSAHPDPRVREAHYALYAKAKEIAEDLAASLESVLDGYERERGGAPVGYDDFCARRDGARVSLEKALRA